MNDQTTTADATASRGLASRKFILAMASLASLSAMLWFGRIDGSLFITGMTVIVGGYLTANVAQNKV